MANDLKIAGIIGTNYNSFSPENSSQSLAAFEDNLAIYGALQLYLDFINIFLRLLQKYLLNK